MAKVGWKYLLSYLENFSWVLCAWNSRGVLVLIHWFAVELTLLSFLMMDLKPSSWKFWRAYDVQYVWELFAISSDSVPFLFEWQFTSFEFLSIVWFKFFTPHPMGRGTTMTSISTSAFRPFTILELITHLKKKLNTSIINLQPTLYYEVFLLPNYPSQQFLP